LFPDAFREEAENAVERFGEELLHALENGVVPVRQLRKKVEVPLDLEGVELHAFGGSHFGMESG